MPDFKIIKQVQVRLFRDETIPERFQTRHTTSWIDLNECPQEEEIITFRDMTWTVLHRWAIREIKIATN